MKKSLTLFLVIYLSFIFFMPKEELLYTGLNIAQKQKIQISIKEQKDLGFYQSLEELLLSYDSSKYVMSDSATILPLLVYNQVSFSLVRATPSFKAILPFTADSIKVVYHIFTPLKLSISGDGDFGEIDGEFDVITQKLKIILTPSKDFEKSNFIKQFKKTKEGYIYESIIR